MLRDTLRDRSPPPLMDEWKGYDNALMELGHNWTNNMCCYVMIGWSLQNRMGWFGLVWFLMVAEEDFETSLVLLFLVDRKLRRFYILITAELLLIQNDKYKTHYIVTVYTGWEVKHDFWSEEAQYCLYIYLVLWSNKILDLLIFCHASANEVADTSPPRPTWPSLGHYKDVPTI